MFIIENDVNGDAEVASCMWGMLACIAAFPLLALFVTFVDFGA